MIEIQIQSIPAAEQCIHHVLVCIPDQLMSQKSSLFVCRLTLIPISEAPRWIPEL